MGDAHKEMCAQSPGWLPGWQASKSFTDSIGWSRYGGWFNSSRRQWFQQQDCQTWPFLVLAWREEAQVTPYSPDTLASETEWGPRKTLGDVPRVILCSGSWGAAGSDQELTCNVSSRLSRAWACSQSALGAGKRMNMKEHLWWRFTGFWGS